MRESILCEKDEFEIYSLDLKKYLNHSVLKKPIFVDRPILELTEIVAKLDVFTTPISVFTREDLPKASAKLDNFRRRIFVVVSNSNLSLLYNVKIKRSSKHNMKVRFSQIITIKSATSLMQPNRLQLLAVSNT